MIMDINDKIYAEKESREKYDKTNQFKDSQMKHCNEKREKDSNTVDDEILKNIEDITSTFSEEIANYYNKEEMKRKIDEFCKENSENLFFYFFLFH